ncbi:MAG: UDP-N-acetylmuramate--L-alanine ligase [Planctomycetota bacterium]
MALKAPVDRVHLLGIGGSGCSGLARLLHGSGVAVSGSDERDGERLQALRDLGIDVIAGPQQLADLDGGWVVRSAAVADSDPLLLEARRREVPCLLYSEFVGKLSQGVRTLAIAGTHGKTSTTALTVSALRAAGFDPSYLVGGDVPDLEGNGHCGASDLFVVEACEFNRSFHQIRPNLAAILNLEHDHFDCYPSREELEESFALYARNLKPGGSLLVHEQVGSRVLSLLPSNISIITIGQGLYCDLRALDVEQEAGRYSFTPCWDQERLPRIDLKLRGDFQATNALFALALAILAGADPGRAAQGLASFRGVERRFSIHYSSSGREIVDDYAHHPGEIRAVLSTVRQVFPGRRVLCAFQPHQHSRTLNLLAEFGQALSLADEGLVADIYAAREDPLADHGIDAEDLAAEIRRAGGQARAAGRVEKLGAEVLSAAGPATIPVILGAGDLDAVVDEVVRGL